MTRVGCGERCTAVSAAGPLRCPAQDSRQPVEQLRHVAGLAVAELPLLKAEPILQAREALQAQQEAMRQREAERQALAATARAALPAVRTADRAPTRRYSGA